MSLYKTILQTLYTDIHRIENSYMGNILHGPTEPTMKSVGHAAALQWTRHLIETIELWCRSNPDAKQAPDSFLPELNSDMKTIIDNARSQTGDMSAYNASSASSAPVTPSASTPQDTPSESILDQVGDIIVEAIPSIVETLVDTFVED